jgi:hypothetical protein
LEGNFCDKVGKEDIFKPTDGKDSIHEMNIGSGVIVLNFQNAIFKVQCYHIATLLNSYGFLLMVRHNQTDHNMIDGRHN